jgi:WD40 repeat protein
MQSIRIFVSSPSDVKEERQICGKVIERIQGKYWSFVRLDDVFWEEKAIRATAHYQDELINPGECDIVLGILWSRLGSPLPARFQQDRDGPTTGTEWELEEAIEAHARSFALLVADGLSEREANLKAKPDVVVYRRRGGRIVHEDPEHESEAMRQLGRLEEYISKRFHNQDEHHTIRRPISGYSDLDEFERKLAMNLEEMVLRMIPGLKPGFEPPPISGSPFKGLRAFEFSDSDRYFGRNREIRQIQHQLVTCARDGMPFILIFGASGYGKSSLMRAGLAPLLVRPGGALEEMEKWRRVSFQPSKGVGPLTERLARALLQPVDDEDLEAVKIHPHWPLGGLSYPATGGSFAEVWDTAALARHFHDPGLRSSGVDAVTGRLLALDSHLLLEVDQLEEIFTHPEIDAAQRTAFLETLAGLCGQERVWIVATMRSEFFLRVAEQPKLRELASRGRTYSLPPPDLQSLREMIRYPAIAARLTFAQRVDEVMIGGDIARHTRLDDQILEDAQSSADALPLLEFTLDELYQSQQDGVLTWEAYAAAGGLKGSIARRAREVYGGLDGEAREARHRIFSALVHVDPFQNTITRRRFPLGILRDQNGAGRFLEAFLKARLLVSDEDAQTRQPVVMLAHEALISHWEELALWIARHIGDILASQRLAEAALIWSNAAASEKKGHLLSAARLAEAERIAASPLFILSAGEMEYLRQSKLTARKRLRFFQGATALFAMLALGAGILGWIAKVNGDKAEISRRTAVSSQAKAEVSRRQAVEAEAETARQLVKTQRELENSTLKEAVGWFERAKKAKVENDHLLAAMLAGRAVGYRGYGFMEREAAGSPGVPPLLATTFRTDAGLESERVRMVGEIGSFIGGLKPRLLPVWSSPIVRHHTGPIWSVSVSADGRRLASGGLRDKSIRIWDLETGLLVDELIGPDLGIRSLAISPDGKRLVAGCVMSGAYVWDLPTRKILFSLPGHAALVGAAAFSRDGTRIATGSLGKAFIWDATSGKELLEVAPSEMPVNGLAFSPDGRFLATGSDKFMLWSTETGKRVLDMAGHPDHQVTALAFSSDGNRLATASDDKTVKVWDAPTGREIRTLNGHGMTVASVAFSPDGKRIASGAFSHEIRLWDAADGSPVVTLEGHNEAVLSIAFTPDGKRLASGSGDETVKLWDMRAFKPVGEAAAGHLRFSRVAYCPDGSLLAGGAGSGEIQIWDVITGKEKTVLKGHHGAICGLSFSRDGRKLASTSHDGTVRVWNVSSAKELKAFPVHPKFGATCLLFGPDNFTLITGSHDDTLCVWDSVTGEKLGEVPCGQKGILSIALSADGAILGTGGEDGTLKLWKAHDGTALRTFKASEGSVTSVCFSPDSRRFGFGTSEGEIQLWDADSGKPLKPVTGSKKAIRCVAFSPDSAYMASAAEDGMIRLWDVAEAQQFSSDFGREIGSVSLGADPVSMDFSPDGHFLACGSEDSTVKVWDIAPEKKIPQDVQSMMRNLVYSKDGRLIIGCGTDGKVIVADGRTGITIAPLMAHKGTISCVDIDAQGRRLASGSQDLIALWDLGTGRMIVGVRMKNAQYLKLKLSPDGSRLVFNDPVRGALSLIDTATGKNIEEIRSPQLQITGLDFSPDGGQIATSALDGTVILWDGKTLRQKHILKGHQSAVTGVDFTSDGRRVAAGSHDGTIGIWETVSGDLVRIFGRPAEGERVGARELFVTDVAFSPDDNRIAARRFDKSIELWDAETGKRLREAVDFYLPSFMAPTSPDGAFAARYVGNNIVVEPRNPGFLPDLYRPQQEGLLKFTGDTIQWPCNPSLLTSPEFAPRYTGREALADLAADGGTPADKARYRLESLARTGRWWAAVGMWEEMAGTAPALRNDPSVKAAYFMALVSTSLPEMKPTGTGRSHTHSISVDAPQFEAIINAVDESCVDEPGISLAVAQFTQHLISGQADNIPLEEVKRLVVKLKDFPAKWLEGVALPVFWDKVEGPIPDRAKFFLTECAEEHPEVKTFRELIEQW